MFIKATLCGGSGSFKAFSVGEVIHLAILRGGSGSLHCVFASKWYWPECGPLYIFPPQLGGRIHLDIIVGGEGVLVIGGGSWPPPRPYINFVQYFQIY